MTNEKSRLTPEEVLALRGIRLPAVALKQLRASGIYCEPAISIERQGASEQFVLRGVESGGSVAGLGLYCSFVALDGSFLPWLQRAQSLGANGVHAIVIAPAFTRLEMLWIEGVCELLITSHEVEYTNGSRLPRLLNRILFHARNGRLEKNTRLLPAFLTRAGEPMDIPKQFHEAITGISKGVLCCNCRHTHVLTGPGAAA